MVFAHAHPLFVHCGQPRDSVNNNSRHGGSAQVGGGVSRHTSCGSIVRDCCVRLLLHAERRASPFFGCGGGRVGDGGMIYVLYKLNDKLQQNELMMFFLFLQIFTRFLKIKHKINISKHFLACHRHRRQFSEVADSSVDLQDEVRYISGTAAELIHAASVHTGSGFWVTQGTKDEHYERQQAHS